MAARKKEIPYEMMNPNGQPKQLPLQQPDSPRVVRKRIEKKPKRSFYTFKMLLAVCCIGIFGLMFVQLYVDSQINLVHYEIQSTRSAIDQQLAINEQLRAEISDLSQYSRVIEIATSQGLTFNEDNIVNISR